MLLVYQYLHRPTPVDVERLPYDLDLLPLWQTTANHGFVPFRPRPVSPEP